MKTPPKKSAMVAAIWGATGIAGLMLAHAQQVSPISTSQPSSADSIVAIAADSQSLPQVAPANVPVRGGTFWWVYPGGYAIPTPCLPLAPNAQIYGITPQEFLVDLTGGTLLVTPYQLKQEARVANNAYAAAVTAQVQGLIDLIARIQSPAISTAANAMTMNAQPLGGAGGFSPMDQIQSGIPYLTIAPTGTNTLLITVWNDQGPANYEIWTTPVLTNPSWTMIANGVTGQTNFTVNIGPFQTGFYRAIWDTNAVPIWEAADPNNPSAGILAVFIDNPANGTVIQ